MNLSYNHTLSFFFCIIQEASADDGDFDDEVCDADDDETHHVNGDEDLN